MSDTHLANDPAARTATGEIKDVGQTPPVTTTDQKPDSTLAPEPKPEPKADAKPKEGESLLNKDGEKKEAPTGAPEKYEDFKLPEGFTIDDKTKAEANELFKGLNLPQEGAQKLMDYYTAKVREAADKPHQVYAEMRAKWQADFKADPTLGPREAEIKQNFSRALDSLGDAKLSTAFREALDLTGAGDNPAIIAVIDKLCAQVVEGKSVVGKGPSPAGQTAPGAAPKSAAHAVYPNLP